MKQPTKKTLAEIKKEEAVQTLQKYAPEGSTIFAIIRHVSSSGMSRRISFFVVDKTAEHKRNEIYNLDFLMEKAGVAKRHPKHEGLVIQGCGMDMVFSTVYDLGHIVWGDPLTYTKEIL